MMVPRRNPEGERGSALIIMAIVVVVFLTTTAGMLSFMLARSKVSVERSQLEEQSRATDAATSIKIMKLMRFHDHSIQGTFADGTEYCVILRLHPQGDIFKLTTATKLPGQSTVVTSEVVVERIIAAAASGFYAAIMAKRNIEVGGGCDVNGNCHDLFEQLLRLGVGPTSRHDKLAVASKQGITYGSGASNTAGGGDFDGSGFPRFWSKTDTANPSDNIIDGFHYGADNNLGVVDAYQNLFPFADKAVNPTGGLWGNSANDHFPTTPDQVLNSPDGTSKQRAIQLGTYFTSQNAFDAWVAALPPDPDSGKQLAPPNTLLYCDFQSNGSLSFDGIEWGRTYHTIINHSPQVPEVIRPRGGVPGAPNTAYVDRNNDGNPTPRLSSLECTDSAHGTYVGALIASSSTAGPFGETTHAPGTNGHMAGAPKWDGFGYVKTEPDGTSTVQGPHIKFFGVFILDNMTLMNASSNIFGGICLLYKDSTGSSQSLANGDAQVRYSAAAIDRAIAVNLFTGTSYKIKSYRMNPRTRDAQTAAAKVGVTITVPSPAEDAVDPSNSARTLDGWVNDPSSGNNAGGALRLTPASQTP
ncbi:MAG: hypothetical protein L0206_18140 [Actinobacteria bacterium]|nr:hypothetical protein [Actinomycetota bacterium]